MIITASAQASPPRVDLDVSEAPAGTVRLEVSGAVGRHEWRVRGASAALIVGAGAATLTDWDAPTGREVSYTASAYSATGALLASASVLVVGPPDPPDCSLAWLSDPLDETSAMLVSLRRGSLDALPFEVTSVSLSGPPSAAFPSAAVSGRRRLVKVPLLLRAVGSQQAALLALLEAPTICLRIPSHSRFPGRELLPPVLYGPVTSLSVTPGVGWTVDRSWWSVELAPSTGPRMAAVIPAWSYADLAVSLPSYTDVSTAYATYANLARGNPA